MVRHRRIALTTVAVVASMFAVVAGASPGSSAAIHSTPTVHRGTPVTNMTAGRGTQIVQVDMVTSAFGYGLVANDPFQPRGWIYLVRTSDAASSWSMQSALPFPSFHQSGGELVPRIDFVSRRVGYVASPDGAIPGALFVTTNGGLTWSKVVTPGVAPTFMATANTLAVVTDVCVHPHQESNFNLCPNDLSLYRVGATTPWRSVRVPRTSNVANRDAQLFAVISPTTFVMSEGEPGGGGQHSRLSLSESSDAGITWRHVDDPCAGVGSDQLVTYTSKHWLLSCFLGEGMNQGIGNLWRTNSGGVTWTRVSHGDTEATTLVPSGNRHILFGEVAGATGGVVYSTDGGAQWNRTGLDGEGGAPESLSTIGPTGAIDQVIGALMYRTRDGRRWTAVPELAAGTYQGLPICTARDGVSVSFRWKPLRAAIGPSGMIFTNRGSRDCYLDGAPIVQTVDGTSRTAVGPPADMTYDQKDFVILKAHGGRANAALLIFPTSSYKPASVCKAKMSTGMTISFGSPSHFFARFRTPTKVCTPFSTVQVIEVLPGLSKHFTIT